MNSTIKPLWDVIHAGDPVPRRDAYLQLMRLAEAPVSWAYDVWDQLLVDLVEGDNHLRAIAAQLLSALGGRSDPDDRARKALPALLNATRDKRFVTARHTLQNLWRLGLAGAAQRKRVAKAYAARFADCAAEKHCGMIRSDTIIALRALSEATGDVSLKVFAHKLIASEPDAGLRAKYASHWR